MRKKASLPMEYIIAFIIVIALIAFGIMFFTNARVKALEMIRTLFGIL